MFVSYFGVGKTHNQVSIALMLAFFIRVTCEMNFGNDNFDRIHWQFVALEFCRPGFHCR